MVERTDCTATQLHNRNKCFAQWTRERHRRVQICKHRRVAADIAGVAAAEVVAVDCTDIDCTDYSVDFEDRRRVVAALADIESLDSMHIPMVHISHSILRAMQLQRNPCHN